MLVLAKYDNSIKIVQTLITMFPKLANKDKSKKLTPTDMVVFVAISLMKTTNNGVLAADTGFSERTIRRSISNLKRLGYRRALSRKEISK